MTPKQTALYWRKWAAVRHVLIDFGGFSSSDAAAERHEITLAALGSAKSSKDFTNRDLDAVLSGFESILVISDGPVSSDRRQSQPIARLIYAITQLGLDDAYISAISSAAYNVADWRRLPESDLGKLRFTLTSRARQHRCG